MIRDPRFKNVFGWIKPIWWVWEDDSKASGFYSDIALKHWRTVQMVEFRIEVDYAGMHYWSIQRMDMMAYDEFVDSSEFHQFVFSQMVRVIEQEMKEKGFELEAAEGRG